MLLVKPYKIIPSSKLQTSQKAKQTNKQTNITRRMFDANSIAAKMEQHVSGVIKA